MGKAWDIGEMKDIAFAILDGEEIKLTDNSGNHGKTISGKSIGYDTPFAGWRFRGQDKEIRDFIYELEQSLKGINYFSYSSYIFSIFIIILPLSDVLSSLITLDLSLRFL